MGLMFDETLLVRAVSGLLTGVPTVLLAIVAYVLNALALYTIARRRGLRKPWLAWLPVGDQWLLGSLADQYRYVTRGEVKSRRKALLILCLLNLLLGILLLVLLLAALVQVLVLLAGGFYGQEQLMNLGLSILGLAVPMAALSIARLVVRFLALYDVYKSLDPANSTLYLVLSILISVTAPFFLFFNREKELGMPPRRDAAQEPPERPEQPGSSAYTEKDYL